MGPHDGISALIRRDTRELALSLHLPPEDTARRWPSASQEEDSHQSQTMLVWNSRSWNSSFLNYEKINVNHPVYGILLWQLRATT